MINAHHFFTDTLAKSAEVMEAVNGNVFTFPCDEELDRNPEKPYIVVANRGTQNEVVCKDESSFDGSSDITTVEIVVCGDSDDEVVAVSQLVREEISYAMSHFGPDEHREYGWWLERSEYSDSGIAFNDYTLNRSCILTYRIETSK